MASVYTVAQITAYIKHMFEQDFALNRVWVRGEVSNCKYHTSGHLYFTLKDFFSSIECVMFASSRRESASDDNVHLHNGMQITAYGKIRIYERDGGYRLYVSALQRVGVGELYRIFEERKRILEEMGMFSPEYKKPIPKYAQTIGIVTAETGAAIHDIMNIAARRNPYVQLILCPAQVQGIGAAESIARAIRKLDTIGTDCMIIGRGGGSAEDLWAFNEEIVAQAIFECDTPTISAVGHETDTTIADFTADLRAPTPSAAAELAIFDYAEFLRQIETVKEKLSFAMRKKTEDALRSTEQKRLQLYLLHPKSRLEEKKNALRTIQDRLCSLMTLQMESTKHCLTLFSERLQAASPLWRLSGGYAWVTDQKENAVEGIDQIPSDQCVLLHMKDGIAKARILSVAERRLSGEKNDD